MPWALASAPTIPGESRVSAPVSVLREYCETVIEVEFAAYTFLPSGLMVRPIGPSPAATVAVESAVSAPVVVFREYCETVFEYLLATYTFLPSGLTTTPSGDSPASTVAGDNAVSFPVSGLRAYCETVVVNLFVAEALLPSGLTTTRAVPSPASTAAGDSAVSIPAGLDASATDPPLVPSTKAKRNTTAKPAPLRLRAASLRSLPAGSAVPYGSRGSGLLALRARPLSMRHTDEPGFRDRQGYILAPLYRTDRTYVQSGTRTFVQAEPRC